MEITDFSPELVAAEFAYRVSLEDWLAHTAPPTFHQRQVYSVANSRYKERQRVQQLNTLHHSRHSFSNP